MAQHKSMDVEQARKMFPTVIESANRGMTTVITRHGRPCAAVVPFAAVPVRRRAGDGFLALRGSGRGLYGDAAKSIDAQRKEWD